MKLEDQVCSLDFAKKLKELRVKQESLFRWQEWRELGERAKGYPFEWQLEPGSGIVRDDKVNAPDSKSLIFKEVRGGAQGRN
ncbi:MAG: hypothetical protein QOC81_5018 [Thermoanaerobaculia bacterium]|nr:hypothetical protein [Thermoanaerobaculia bacterium]